MALTRYLPRLRHFYYGLGTGGLIDQVGSADFTEQNAVGLNAEDGPPPEPKGTSRGPLSGVDGLGVGFQRSPVSGDNWRLLTDGVTDFTFFCWCRLDELTTDQELFAVYTATAAQQAELVRFEVAFTNFITHAKGADSNHDAGSAGVTINPPETDGWNMVGVSMGGGVHKLFANGKISTKTGFGATYAATSLSPVRIGMTVTGVSADGLLGDVAYVNNFDYAFDDIDWQWFWRGGAGRRYPHGYTRTPGVNPHVLAARGR